MGLVSKVRAEEKKEDTFFDRIYMINGMGAQFSDLGQRWRRKASTLTSEVDADENNLNFLCAAF